MPDFLIANRLGFGASIYVPSKLENIGFGWYTDKINMGGSKRKKESRDGYLYLFFPHIIELIILPEEGGLLEYFFERFRRGELNSIIEYLRKSAIQYKKLQTT